MKKIYCKKLKNPTVLRIYVLYELTIIFLEEYIFHGNVYQTLCFISLSSLSTIGRLASISKFDSLRILLS